MAKPEVFKIGRFKDYELGDGWSSFRKWLVEHGASLVPPLNSYEIYRAQTRHGWIIGYKNKRGGTTHPPDAMPLVDAWKKGQTIPSLSKNSERKSRTSNKRRQVILACLKRDGFGCFYCGKPLANPYEEPKPQEEKATHEHFLAIANGGPDSLHNSLAACLGCNNKAGKMSITEKVRFRESKRSST